MTSAGSSLASRLLFGGLWAAGGRVLSVGAFAATHFLLARLLDPETYGAFVLVWSVVFFAATMGALGLEQGAVRLISEELARGRFDLLPRTAARVLRWGAVGAVTVALVYLGAHRWLARRLFDAPALLPLAWPIALWIVAAVLQRLVTEILRGLKDIRLAALFGPVSSIGIVASAALLTGVAALGAAGAGSLRAVVLLTATVIASTAALGGAALAVRLSVLSGPRAARGSEAAAPAGSPPALASLAWPLLGVSLLISLRVQLDVWLVGTFADTSDVALFGAARRLATLVPAPLLIANAALAPLIAEAWAKGGRARTENIARIGATAATLAAAAPALLALLLPGALLAVLFGDYYAAGAPVLVLLVAGQLLNVAAGPNLLTLIMRGRERAALVGVAVPAAALLGFGPLLAASWGILGVAAGSAAALVLQNLLVATMLRLRLGLRTHAFGDPRAVRRALLDILERDDGGGGASRARIVRVSRGAQD